VHLAYFFADSEQTEAVLHAVGVRSAEDVFACALAVQADGLADDALGCEVKLVDAVLGLLW